MKNKVVGKFVFAIFFISTLALGSTPAQLTQFLNQSGAKKNIVKSAKGILPYSYLVPSGPYTQLFDWDMYFMGVALSYDGMGWPVANSVKDFASFVGINANVPGYVPREIATDGFWALPEQCKPFIAQAAVRASRTLGDYEWARGIYDKLKAMLGFWETTRRAPDGLFVWFDGTESGVDNNPAVLDAPALVTEGVDLQTYLVREYRAMAVLATHLGLSSDAVLFAEKAKGLQALMVAKMWSASDGLFYNLDARTGQPIKVKSWTSFVPLWAHLASDSQAKTLIEDHLLSESEFWGPHGVRTVSKSESVYDPNHGYWRGPVWVISNYLLMHGLLSYGYQDRAVELAQKTLDLLVSDFSKSGGMNECYNPETGEPTAGGHFVSWDLLGEHIVQEAQTATDPTAF